MERIVTTGLKIDLHIHSHASARKDGKKVKNNTVENLPLLIQRLNNQGVVRLYNTGLALWASPFFVV